MGEASGRNRLDLANVGQGQGVVFGPALLILDLDISLADPDEFLLLAEGTAQFLLIQMIPRHLQGIRWAETFELDAVRAFFHNIEDMPRFKFVGRSDCEHASSLNSLEVATKNNIGRT